MSAIKMFVLVASLCISSVAGAHFISDQNAKATSHDRAHVVVSETMPNLDGAHLKATLVEVNYGPGEASPPHSHPCAVVGYVAEGAIRTQVKGEAEKTLEAGQGFYEPPNGIHLVSANASSTAPAKLVAYLLCDRDTALSVDVPGSQEMKKGEGK